MPVLFAEIDWSHFAMNLMAAAAFGLLGIIMLVLGFKAFDKITPKLDIEGELVKGNVAVGIFVAAMLIAIALIAKMAIGG